MPTPIELVDAQAMKLTPNERADLADKLWLSVNSKEEVDAAWDAEIPRRIDQLDAGEVECIPLEHRDGGVARQMRLKRLIVHAAARQCGPSTHTTLCGS